MFTCTTLRHAPLEWQNNTGGHPKAFKSKEIADRPNHSNKFNYKIDGGKKASCCAATGHELLTLPGIVDTYTFLMDTWNILLESYQQRVYENTLPSVKRKIQQVENPVPAMVISVEAAHVHNPIHLDYFTSELALEEPEIRSTHSNIPRDINCTDHQLHFGMQRGTGDYADRGEESDEHHTTPTAARQQQAAIKFLTVVLRNSDVDRYEG